MNEKKAKKLRKLVFGDKAYHGTQTYRALFFDRKARQIDISGGLVARYVPFTVILDPDTPHAVYRVLKRRRFVP